LLEKAQELLEVDEPEIQITLDEMLRTNDVIGDTGLEHEVEAVRTAISAKVMVLTGGPGTGKTTTTLDFHHQLKGAILDAVDEGLIPRDPTRKAIIKGKTPRIQRHWLLHQKILILRDRCYL